jgi:hypothetical protein
MSSRSRSGRDEKNASSEGPGRLLNIFFADNGLSSTVQDRARLDRRVESGAYAPPAPRATSLRSAPISKRHRPRDSCAIDGRAERVSHRHPGRRSSHKTMWDGWHTGARRRGGANSNSMLKEFRPSPTRAPDRGGVFVRCGSPLADVHGHALFRTESQSLLGARAIGLKRTDDSHRSCSSALRRQRPQVRILSGAPIKSDSYIVSFKALSVTGKIGGRKESEIVPDLVVSFRPAFRFRPAPTFQSATPPQAFPPCMSRPSHTPGPARSLETLVPRSRAVEAGPP